MATKTTKKPAVKKPAAKPAAKKPAAKKPAAKKPAAKKPAAKNQQPKRNKFLHVNTAVLTAVFILESLEFLHPFSISFVINF